MREAERREKGGGEANLRRVTTCCLSNKSISLFLLPNATSETLAQRMSPLGKTCIHRTVGRRLYVAPEGKKHASSESDVWSNRSGDELKLSILIFI